uniref:Uncharacterized protein n=1 Tax=Chestnut teal chaphamaparvovirus TaxID=2759402 RepID=A0A7D7B5N5_9VIRU|nr:hypothetical protein [Chestnut teal chaphamaparvovirus]
MATGFGGQGCTFLIWVKPDSWRLEGMDSNQRDEAIKGLLEDAVCLLTGRWSIEATFLESKGITYGFLVCPRFAIGIPTAIRALGTLGDHIAIHRGGATSSGKELIRYIECKRQYEVPDVVSEGTSGDQDQPTGYQTSWKKTTKRS